MTFHNVSFPTRTVAGQELPIVDYGTNAGTGFAVSVFDSGGQRSHRVLRSSAPRDVFSLRASTMQPDEAKELSEFFIARNGPFATFRFLDVFDCYSHNAGRAYNSGASVTANDQILGTGDGTTTQFQLRKGYGPSAFRVWRTVRLPVEGTVVVALDGTPDTGWSVDTATGIVTFTTAPGAGVQVTAGFKFEKVVRFSGDLASAGLRITAEGFDFSSAGDIQLIEEPEENPNHDCRPHGGSRVVSPMTESVSLSVPGGELNVLGPTVAGLSAYLPEPSDIGDGAGYFLVVNEGSEALTVRDHQGASMATVAAAGSQRFHLQRGTGGLSWLTTAA